MGPLPVGMWAQVTERHGCAPALTGAQLMVPMMPRGDIPQSNLAALPISEIELLRPHLSRMTMVSGQVLHEANSPITDVFFIENGVVSLAADTLITGGSKWACSDEKDLRVRQ